MAISDLEYTNWLSTPSAFRCVLVEASVNSGGSEVVRYMSNVGYVTGASDSPANTPYRALIKGSIKLTETLSLESNATLSYGDIELDNTDGTLDSWIEDVWDNRNVSVFFGDMRWARSDFRLIFKGTFSGVSSKGRERINLILRDSLQRLNTPISDVKLGGSSTNKDRLIPLTFGECHNVSPLLTSAAGHEYQVHNGAVEDVIEVRDNGAPITVTKSLGAGKFTLAASPVGTITASVQGSKPSTYSNQIGELIKLLVKSYGTSEKLTDSDIDLTNFSDFAAANTAPVGLYLPDRTNLLDACQQLAGSVGAQVTMSRIGKLQLKRIDFPPAGTPRLISRSDIAEHKLEVDSVLDVVPAIRLGYCKNYTVENNLQTVIPEEHKSLYEQEWLTTTKSDSTVATKYKMLVEPVQKDTLLLTTATADTEAQRRLDIVKQQRTVYKMVCFTWMFELALGDAVTLKYPRFGLDSGELGVVVGLEPDWMNARITVKVMV
mgnify:CR=1 FL=1